MRHLHLRKLLALLFAFVIIAAACGDDGDDDTAGDDAATDAGSDETTAPADDDSSGDDAAADDGGEDAAPAGDGQALADDSIFGNGAEAWEQAVQLGEANPLAAEGDPITMFLVNLEGSPGGSFPEVREGLEIGIEYINNTLGGVGADLAAGTPGRPLQLDSCPHALDPAEAQACATESVAANPDIIVKGIDFFSPVMWPVWGGQIPVIDALPIFVSDFTATGSLAMSGGCVVAFPGAAQMMAEELGHDRIAIIYADNAPGQECWADTQERFYQYFSDQGVIEFRGFPDAVGDPADNDANVQEVLNYLEGAESGAVHFGIQASDCAEYNDALDAAGNTYDVYNSGSCVDDAVQSAQSATGKHFGFTGPPAPENADLLAQFHPFWQWEVTHREQVLMDGEPESPLSTFMRLGFNTAVMAYEVTGNFIASGGDPSDHAGLIEFMANIDNQHRVGNNPLDCANKVDEWGAVCDFRQMYFTWDGSQFVLNPNLEADPADPNTWTDVKEILATVAVEVPRADG